MGEWAAFTAEAGGPRGSASNRIGDMVGQRGPGPVAPASFLSQKAQELQMELSVELRLHFSRGGSVSHFLPWALQRTPGMGRVWVPVHPVIITADVGYPAHPSARVRCGTHAFPL